ncbi:SRPBCC family protein [Jatrophihabitans fulvus]
MHGEVTVRMAAPPEKVWELVSDVTRIGEFSPETFEAEWLGGATGPALGATFRGHVKRNGRGPVYWTTCKVTQCEPGKVFGFAVVGGGRTFNNWSYRIEPDGDGSRVTEAFDIQPNLAMRAYWLVAGRLRRRTNENGMRQTLERIKAVVEG